MKTEQENNQEDNDIIQRRFEKEQLKNYNDALKFLSMQKYQQGVDILKCIINQPKIKELSKASHQYQKLVSACFLNIAIALQQLNVFNEGQYYYAKYFQLNNNDYRRMWDFGLFLAKRGQQKSALNYLSLAVNSAINANEKTFALVVLKSLFTIAQQLNLNSYILELCNELIVNKNFKESDFRFFKEYQKVVSHSNDNRIIPSNSNGDGHNSRRKSMSQAQKIYLDWPKLNNEQISSECILTEKKEIQNLEIQVKLTEFNYQKKIRIIFQILQKIILASLGKEQQQVKNSKQPQTKINYQIFHKMIIQIYQKDDSLLNKKQQIQQAYDEKIEQCSHGSPIHAIINNKLQLCLCDQDIALIDGSLQYFNISFKSLFGFDQTVNWQKRLYQNISDLDTYEKLQTQQELLLLQQINNQSSYNVLQNVVNYFFSERTQTFIINKKRTFFVYGPLISLQYDFLKYQNSFVQLFDYALQYFPQLINFDSLIIFTELLQFQIQMGRKQEFESIFASFITKLENQWLEIDENFFEEKEKENNLFVEKNEKENYSLFDTCNNQLINIITQQELEVISVNSDQLSIQANFGNNNLIEFDEEKSENKQQQNIQEIVNIKETYKERLQQLQLFEKTQQYQQCNKIIRNNFGLFGQYWQQKQVIFVNNKNAEKITNWIFVILSIEQIELLQHFVIFDFTKCYEHNKPVQTIKAQLFVSLLDNILNTVGRKNYSMKKTLTILEMYINIFDIQQHTRNYLHAVLKIEKNTLKSVMNISNNNIFQCMKIALQLLFINEFTYNDIVQNLLLIVFTYFENGDHNSNYLFFYSLLHNIMDLTNIQTKTLEVVLKNINIVKNVFKHSSILIQQICPDNKISLLSLQNSLLIIQAVKQITTCHLDKKLSYSQIQQFLIYKGFTSEQIQTELVDDLLERRKTQIKNNRACQLNQEFQNPKIITLSHFERQYFQFEMLYYFFQLDNDFDKHVKITSQCAFFNDDKFSSFTKIKLFNDIRIDKDLFSFLFQIFNQKNHTYLFFFFKNLHSLIIDNSQQNFINYMIDTPSLFDILANKITTYSQDDLIKIFIGKLKKSSLAFFFFLIRFSEQMLFQNQQSYDYQEQVKEHYQIIIKLYRQLQYVDIMGNMFKEQCRSGYLRILFQLNCINQNSLDPLPISQNEELGNDLEDNENIALFTLTGIYSLYNSINLNTQLKKALNYTLPELQSNSFCQKVYYYIRKINNMPQYIKRNMTYRIDYTLVFIIPDNFINMHQGNLKTILQKLQEMWLKSSKQKLFEYAGTFKPFYNKKENIKKFNHTFSYAIIFANYFNFIIRENYPLYYNQLSKGLYSYFDYIKKSQIYAQYANTANYQGDQFFSTSSNCEMNKSEPMVFNTFISLLAFIGLPSSNINQQEEELQIKQYCIQIEQMQKKIFIKNQKHIKNKKIDKIFQIIGDNINEFYKIFSINENGIKSQVALAEEMLKIVLNYFSFLQQGMIKFQLLNLIQIIDVCFIISPELIKKYTTILIKHFNDNFKIDMRLLNRDYKISLFEMMIIRRSFIFNKIFQVFAAHDLIENILIIILKNTKLLESDSSQNYIINILLPIFSFINKKAYDIKQFDFYKALWIARPILYKSCENNVLISFYNTIVIKCLHFIFEIHIKPNEQMTVQEKKDFALFIIHSCEYSKNTKIEIEGLFKQQKSIKLTIDTFFKLKKN